MSVFKCKCGYRIHMSITPSSEYGEMFYDGSDWEIEKSLEWHLCPDCSCLWVGGNVEGWKRFVPAEDTPFPEFPSGI